MSSHSHAGECYATNLTQRTDPTHTYDIRQQFLQDIRGRFRRVSGVIRRTAGYTEDAFDLSQNKLDATEAYDFPTERDQIQAFMEDVKAWLAAEILEPANFSELRNGEHWTSEYITNAYLTGQNVAVGRLKQEGVSASAATVESLLESRTSLKTLRDLYARTYENLQDITDDAAGVIRQELTEGFAQGENPKKIADRLTSELKTMQRTRAEVLARTEVLNAANQSALDEYEKAGVQTVAHGDWQTAMDTRVCPFCRRVGNETFRLSELRANHAVEFRGQVYRLMPPSHPNGRCTLIPKVGFDGDLEPLSERVPGQLLT